MLEFWSLKTWQNCIIAAKRKNGHLVQLRLEEMEESDYIPLIAISVSSIPDYFFLTVAKEVPFLWVSHMPLKGRVLPLLVKKSEKPFQVHLADPICLGNYLTAHPLKEAEKSNELLGDCCHAMGWETFFLESHPAPSAFFEEVGKGIADLFHPNLLASEILDFLLKKQVLASRKERKETALKGVLCSVLDACLPVISRAEVNKIGQHLLLKRDILSFLKRADSAPSWVIEGFQNLERWKKKRSRAQKKKFVSNVKDASVAIGEDSAFAGLLHAALHGARRQTMPKFKSCLVTTVRNEGIYLLEWIAYHRALGIDRIFLYSNGNVDGSSALLEALHENGSITYIENIVPEGVSPQFKAYGHALNILPDVLDYEWCFILDGDEFITLDPKSFSKINDYLDHMGRWEGDAIAFNWKMMASELCFGGMADLAKPLTERNQRIVGAGAIGEGKRLVKAAHRSGYAIQSRAHHPVSNPMMRFMFRSPDGRPYEYINPPPGFGRDPSFSDIEYTDQIYISHYYFKSMLEWTWKYSRNTGTDPESAMGTDRYREYWANSFGLQLMDKHQEKDAWIKARMQEAMQELVRLRQVPLIRKAENQVRALLSAHLHRLVAQILKDDVASRLSEKWRFLLGDLLLEAVGDIPAVLETEDK